eukprot:394306-Amphidinium_carterae.1
MTSYFDDFPCIEAELTSKSASRVVEGILTLTGWTYDDRGHKYVDFSTNAVVLGAFMKIGCDSVLLGNTPSRLQQIRTHVEQLLGCRSWSRLDADRLCGRLNFVRSLIAGRPLNSVLYGLYARAASVEK